jgi:hypothetical protein
MFSRPIVAGLTAVAALATGAAGSATASAAPLPPGDAPLGSPGLIQRKAVAPAFPGPPRRCRAWRVQGQSWFAAQSNGYTLMFTLRSAASAPSRFSGYAQYFQGSSQKNLTGSQFIRGGVGTMSNGFIGIHMDVVWRNGSSGQYNATAYDAQPTSSGGLTAALHGTTVDTSGGGAAARWWADGLEGPLGDTSHIRPLYCPRADVVR